jgi:hypothetical protein
LVSPLVQSNRPAYFILQAVYPSLLRNFSILQFHEFFTICFSPGVKNDLMIQVIGLFQKLRQLPKLIARLIIALSKSADNKADLVWSEVILKCFGDKVVSLPTGQLLEMWKTFNYHMSSSTNDKVIKTIEALMPVFLASACLVDQSIPDPTIDKVLESIKTTRQQQSRKVFPKVCEALDELSIMLKCTRQIDVLIMMDPDDTLGRLQKRKLESIMDDDKGCSKKNKTSLQWREDVKTCPQSTWSALLPALDDHQLDLAVRDILSSPIMMETGGQLFQECTRMQRVLVKVVIDQLVAKNPKISFLSGLQKDNLDEASREFEQNMMQLVIKLPDDPDHPGIAAILSQLPLEQMSGPLEASVTLMLIAMAKTNNTVVNKLLARCLDNTFRLVVGPIKQLFD